LFLQDISQPKESQNYCDPQAVPPHLHTPPPKQHHHLSKNPQRNTINMGAVMSCIQGIGDCIMTVIRAIAGVIMSIVNGVVAVLSAIVRFLTCKKNPYFLGVTISQLQKGAK
jgi:hypothetical protein